MSSQEEQMYSAVVGTATQSVRELSSAAIEGVTDAILKMPRQIRAEVSPSDRTAHHDVSDARNMLTEGMSKDEIKIEVRQSPACQDCDNPDLYATAIVNLAERENILENAPPLEVSVSQGHELQL